ncbi:hypothetical protein VFPFJ_02216 [Purpureocillium lilacinum]|uniref:Uncharacterized protein n=1 Tax=Purpureocillium lilacinum TaxID=33203 RepID=A0A179HRG9_PURLI|nr:hypothetical protein VFPFJ_02216 [Purpureocillium lilacinum]OAQ93055.1 hypothetical protein VFPFJ_02216 [Purpureocillium lilacinum]
MVVVRASGVVDMGSGREFFWVGFSGTLTEGGTNANVTTAMLMDVGRLHATWCVDRGWGPEDAGRPPGQALTKCPECRPGVRLPVRAAVECLRRSLYFAVAMQMDVSLGSTLERIKLDP